MKLILNFTRPYLLVLLLILPLTYLIYKQSSRQIKKTREKVALLIRILLFTLLVLALAQPSLKIPLPGQTIIFLVDHSESILPKEYERSREFIQNALTWKKKTDKAGIITFGASPSIEIPPGEDLYFSKFQSAPPGYFTNIESGLELALANLPVDGNRRVVLISDGQENSGQAALVALKFKEQGIPIDVFPLKNQTGPEVLLEELFLPSTAKIDEEFSVRILCYSSQEAEGVLRLYCNDLLVKTEPITLHPGKNFFLFLQSLSMGGTYHYRAEIEAEPDTCLLNNQGTGLIMVSGEKRLLIVGKDDPETQNFINLLSTNGFSIKQKSLNNFYENFTELSSYAAIILNNIPYSKLTPGQIDQLQTYVYDLGGGIITIAGRDNYSRDNQSQSDFEAMLPIHSSLEQRILFPTLTLLPIIDVSGSMDEEQDESGITKIRLAKEAIIAALDLLINEERIGILAFSNRPRWVVPIQNAEDKERIIQRIAPLQAGGNTNLYPALEEAYRALSREKTSIRHILLLSDGISEPGDFKQLASAITSNGITISTVGIGKGADRKLLADLAVWGGGKTYYTEDFSSIPQIFITETSRLLRPAVREESFQPTLQSLIPPISGIDWQQAPKLHGFVAATPRDLATTFLTTPDHSPLLSGWRYGLGRTVSFLSDLGQDWARDWLEWKDYKKFWSQVINWVIPSQQHSTLFPQFFAKNDLGIIKVDALDHKGDFMNFLTVKARITGPEHQVITNIPLTQTGPGEYQGSFSLEKAGDYLAAITWKQSISEIEEGPILVGLSVPYSPEYRFFVTDNQLLLKLAAFTGGKILSTPDEVFQLANGFNSKTINLGPWILLFVLYLFLIDVAIRFLPGIVYLCTKIQQFIFSRRQFFHSKIKKAEEYEELVQKSRKDPFPPNL